MEEGINKVKKGVCMKEEKMSMNMNMDMRKGPWSVEEDTILINHVATHGDRHWNSLARSSGLKRSGKSCRLRWVNYLRPDVRRGNITLQEQITILDLHSRWGNRWSKIAEHLPGRTDNEIKNYWRTRVSKQAKQLNCDVNSQKFRDALRYVWIPLLLERVQIQPPSQVDPNPIVFGSGSGKVCTDSSSSVEMQQVNNTDSGQSVGSDQMMGQQNDVWVNSGGNDPSLNNNSQMFEYTSWDLVLDSLWNDQNIWVLPPLCDDDQGLLLELEDNFLA